MWIFYLVEVLDTTKIIAGISMVVIAVTFCAFWANYEFDCCDCEENYPRKTAMKFLWAFILTLAITIICPSKRTSYTMLGVGSVIDYLRDNDTAKQLPDKAIIALDKWLDNYTEKEEQL